MNLNRAAHLLAQGLGPSQVASLMGCTPARITQLKSESSFQNLLMEAQEEWAAAPEALEEELLSNKYASTEHRILKQLDDSIGFLEPRDMLRALEIVSKRQEEMKKRKAAIVQHQQNPQGTIITVSLTIPQHAVPEYTMNTQGEIVSINQKPMAALSSTGVKNLFNSLKNLTAEGVAPQLVSAA